MFYVYLLKSLTIDNWVYVGSCDDLRKRFQKHNAGEVVSTKARKPYRLIYYEAYRDKTEARKREIELKKSWSKKQELLKRLENSLK
ncbi:MAG: GIY-YIG nuclease family protein [Candidatus Magasanikbacteria bacterium]|nr:GIY-YIG nuclease family protein [Candidatus Magasanikbacteria bacterium]